MSLEFESITGPDVANLIPDLARLRGVVFREWPYLYDVDPAYEARYLSGYAQAGAIVVTARDGGELVGAATGMPLLQHVDNLSTALEPHFTDLNDVFYCAESVLLFAFRGQGAGQSFFDLRETHARDQGFSQCVFCAVERPDDHPARPQGHRSLAPFWQSRGYRRLGVEAHLAWRDIGDGDETEKPMAFWGRRL